MQNEEAKEYVKSVGEALITGVIPDIFGQKESVLDSRGPNESMS